MGIDFTKERWVKLKDDYRKWWAGELKRPIINITLTGARPQRPEPTLPAYGFTAFYDLSVPAEAVVDRWDYDLSCRRFPGDAFPAVWSNFGAGVLAAFLGASLVPDTNTVWFRTSEIRKLEDIRFEYDADNPWLCRIRDIYRAGLDRWQGLVQMGMTDLGGNLDILSTFRPGEKLLLDLYDNPEEVKRLLRDEHRMWWKYYDELNALLQPVNPGYTCWTPIYSESQYYMFQCDFAYMIGPSMFDEFARPELAASYRRIPNGFYHLDGTGQLPHLDSLLAIPELKGIQWIPGAGNPDMAHWPEVYRKIRDAGKLIQIFGGLDILDALAEQLGSAEGICLVGSENVSREREVMAGLRRYGAV